MTDWDEQDDLDEAASAHQSELEQRRRDEDEAVDRSRRLTDELQRENAQFEREIDEFFERLRKGVSHVPHCER